MSIALIESTCVACGGRFRVEPIHFGRRLACPHCQTQQVVHPPAPSTTDRIAKPITSGFSKPIAEPASEPAEPEKMALFTCSGCQFRARVPATTSTVACPRCGASGPVNLIGLPKPTGSTAWIVRPDHPTFTSGRLRPASPPSGMAGYSQDRAPTSGPVRRGQTPRPSELQAQRLDSSPFMRNIVPLFGMICVLLAISLVVAIFLGVEAAGHRVRWATVNSRAQDLQADLERVREQLTKSEIELAALRTSRSQDQAELERLRNLAAAPVAAPADATAPAPIATPAATKEPAPVTAPGAGTATSP